MPSLTRSSPNSRWARLAAASDILDDLRREAPDLAEHADRLMAAAGANDYLHATWPRLAPLHGGSLRSRPVRVDQMRGQEAA
jgi:hypothetical protein